MRNLSGLRAVVFLRRLGPLLSNARAICGTRSPRVTSPGLVLPEKLVGGVRRAAWNPYLFQTKICDFPYPISDLTLKSIPYIRPVL